MNRYETNSKGQAPALSALLNEFAKMPRSAFDHTHQKIFDGAPYAVIPFDTFFMFPDSEMYLNYSVDCITKNPFIKRLLSACSIEIRTYYCKCSDLWEGWNNFITRGRSGKLNLQIPAIAFRHLDNSTTPATYYHTALPYNPAHYLNIAPAIEFKNNQSFDDNQGIIQCEDSNYLLTGLTGLTAKNQVSNFLYQGAMGDTNALPFVFYAKIAKEFQNANLLQNNPYWYPENENHDLILPYTITQQVTTASYDYPYAQWLSTVDSNQLNSLQPTNDKHSMPWLNVLYYRQRKGNYFNTASPFPDLIRGDVPTIDILNGHAEFYSELGAGTLNTFGLIGFTNNGSSSNLADAYPNVSGDQELRANGGNANEQFYKFTNSSGSAVSTKFSNQSTAVYGQYTNKAIEALNKNIIKGANLSIKQFRNVLALTVFRERMARTDGSYNEMIQAQFKFNPRWHEHKPIYCGGHYQPLVFSEVVQQSADANSPLGTTAGRAVSSATSKSIKVTSNDYGIMMSVLTVTPDDFYSQGLQRIWSELTQVEQYFPILNNLNPQAIKNKELFMSGNYNTDNDVFAYQELFSHFKSRQNEVSGLLSLPISLVGDTGAYLFNRLFTATPQFNNSFVTGKFTSNENLVFSSTEQAQFIFKVSCFAKYIAPMPAVTMPSDFGLSY